MAFLTIRVPESLRKNMKRIRGVNWSDFIRGSIEEKVREEVEKRREKDRTAILEAIQEQDKIAATLGEKPVPEWSGVEVIRYWRKHRYSSLMPQ